MSNRLKPTSGTPAAAGRRVAIRGATDLSAELARLSCLSVDDLKLAWTETFGGVAPKNARRDHLLRAIAHELQCKSFGGIAKSLHRALMKIADAKPGESIEAAKRTRSLKLGARIYREWKGRSMRSRSSKAATGTRGPHLKVFRSSLARSPEPAGRVRLSLA